MNPKARYAYLTLVGNKPLLNLILEQGDIFCIEITEGHLRNMVQDGVRMAFRPDGGCELAGSVEGTRR